jgi:hypothetical protein
MEKYVQYLYRTNQYRLYWPIGRNRRASRPLTYNERREYEKNGTVPSTKNVGLPITEEKIMNDRDNWRGLRVGIHLNTEIDGKTAYLTIGRNIDNPTDDDDYNFSYHAGGRHDRWERISADGVPVEFGAIKPEEEVNELMTTVSKKLSMCLLVSSSEFARLPAAKQTELALSASGSPVIFVDNFVGLRNKKKLIERLLNGEDVSMELEFNEIELSDADKKALSDAKPIIERIRGTTGSYDWKYEGETSEEAKKFLEKKGYNCTPNQVTANSGYHVSKAQAKKIWEYASYFWSTGDKGDEVKIQAHYESRRIKIDANDNVHIGCQQASREVVEAVARYFELEPKTEKK